MFKEPTDSGKVSVEEDFKDPYNDLRDDPRGNNALLDLRTIMSEIDRAEAGSPRPYSLITRVQTPISICKESKGLISLGDKLVDMDEGNAPKQYKDPRSAMPVLVMEIYSDSARRSRLNSTTVRDLVNSINREIASTEAASPTPSTPEPVTSVPQSSNHLEQQYTCKLARRARKKLKMSIKAASETVTHLRIRDIRHLDFHFNPLSKPHVSIRKSVVLMALDPIRACVMSSAIFLIVPDGADSLLQIFEDHLEKWKSARDSQQDLLAQNRLSENEIEDSYEITSDKFVENVEQPVNFEHHAYEALFITVNAIHSQCMSAIKGEVLQFLGFMKHGYLLPVDKQEKMRELKNSISALLSDIVEYRVCLQRLMDDDQDMALMNLTLLQSRPELYLSSNATELLPSHEAIECLLESCLLDFNHLESQLNSILTQIQNAEDSISLRLDTARNQLLIANTTIAILACSIAIGAFVTGIFGMNLDNNITLIEVKGLFVGVMLAAILLIIIVYTSVVSYFRSQGILPS